MDVGAFINSRTSVEELTLDTYVSTANLLPDFAGVTSAESLPHVGSAISFKPKDILISNIRPYLRKIWIATFKGGASNDVIVVRAKSGIKSSFLGYIIKSDAFIDYVMSSAKGVKMPRGDISLIREYPTLVPFLPAEQQKIADCLGSLDAAIAAQAAYIEVLRKYKKGLMQQLFPQPGERVPRLRFPEFTDAGEWEEKPLGSFIEIINVRIGHNNTDAVPLSITSGVGLVPQIEKFGRIIAGEQLKNYILLEKYDFAYNKSATKEYPEGFIALYKGNSPGCVPNSIFTCFRITDKRHEAQFLDYVFQMNQHGQHLKRFVEVGARAHGSLAINNEDILNIPIILPTYLEQQKIADCLGSLDAAIAVQMQQLEKLREHKKGLMQGLFPRTRDK